MATRTSQQFDISHLLLSGLIEDGMIGTVRLEGRDASN
jgi:hypothetical protein